MLMDRHDHHPPFAISTTSNSYPLINAPSLNHSACLEIRLFYVRIASCVINNLPDHLKLRHLRPEIGLSLQINGTRVPASDAASLTLRRDRIDKESLEVTYVSTDSVQVTGGIEFEVYENENMMLCGSLERMESNWGDDSKTGWAMDCYMSAAMNWGSPSIEVYIAGCCSGVPVILTKKIQMTPRRKVPRHGMLDAIPEGEEIEKEHKSSDLQKLQSKEARVDDYELDQKMRHRYYSEDMYSGEDGQLSWFNAGVRVGVGIGLGMCIGVGIGAGLLMRTYQATTKNLRRRFFYNRELV